MKKVNDKVNEKIIDKLIEKVNEKGNEKILEKVDPNNEKKKEHTKAKTEMKIKKVVKYITKEGKYNNSILLYYSIFINFINLVNVTQDEIQKKIIQSSIPKKPEINKRIKDNKKISQIVI